MPRGLIYGRWRARRDVGGVQHHSSHDVQVLLVEAKRKAQVHRSLEDREARVAAVRRGREVPVLEVPRVRRGAEDLDGDAVLTAYSDELVDLTLRHVNQVKLDAVGDDVHLDQLLRHLDARVRIELRGNVEVPLVVPDDPLVQCRYLRADHRGRHGVHPQGEVGDRQLHALENVRRRAQRMLLVELLVGARIAKWLWPRARRRSSQGSHPPRS